MFKSGLALQERRLVILLRWWCGIFAAAAASFAIFPQNIISSLNIIGHVIFKWDYQPLPEPSEHFWQIMAVSLLLLLTTISYFAQKDIRERLVFVPLIIFSKFVTTVGFIAAFFLSGNYFAYLAGAVIDGMIFLITWYYYARAKFVRAS